MEQDTLSVKYSITQLADSGLRANGFRAVDWKDKEDTLLYREVFKSHISIDDMNKIFSIPDLSKDTDVLIPRLGCLPAFTEELWVSGNNHHHYYGIALLSDSICNEMYAIIVGYLPPKDRIFSILHDGADISSLFKEMKRDE